MGPEIKVIFVPGPLLYIDPEKLSIDLTEKIRVERDKIIDTINNAEQSRINLIIKNPKKKREFLDLLSENPHILHFSGRMPSLELAGENEITVSDSFYVVKGLKSLKNRIKCLTLSSCYSCNIAKVFMKHVDCVVGTSKGMDPNEAFDFISAFYRYLVQGKSLGEAIKIASAPFDGLDDKLPSHKCENETILDNIYLFKEYDQTFEVTLDKLPPDIIHTISAYVRVKPNASSFLKGVKISDRRE